LYQAEIEDVGSICHLKIKSWFTSKLEYLNTSLLGWTGL
jgi:hypothetical protein